MRSILTLLVSALVGVLIVSTSPAEPKRTPAPDSARTAVARMPAADDTSMLTGSGLNAKSWAIDRPVPGGVMRKDPGTRTWYFVKALSDAEMRVERERQLQDLLAKHGHEPRDVVIDVPDTTVARKLAALKIEAKSTPPCTLVTTVLYRQLPELQKQGILFWENGSPRPGSVQLGARKYPPTKRKDALGPPPPGSVKTTPPPSPEKPR